MTETEGQQPLWVGRRPAYTEWLRAMNQKMDTQGVPRSATIRARKLARWTPRWYRRDTAYRAARDGTIGYLRGQNARAIPAQTHPGKAYIKVEQMTLIDLQAFLIDNHDSRTADVRAEVAFVRKWCAIHATYTVEQVYNLVGLTPPA